MHSCKHDYMYIYNHVCICVHLLFGSIFHI
jgi:hypothetical protein